MNQASGKRVEWIDYARISAILCVILCHAVESCYRPVILGEQRIGILPWIVETLCLRQEDWEFLFSCVYRVRFCLERRKMFFIFTENLSFLF